MGIPALMMALLATQLDPALPIGARRLGIDTCAIKRERQDLALNILLSRLHAWEQGRLSSHSVLRALAKLGEAILRTSVHHLSNPDNNSTVLHADTKKNACWRQCHVKISPIVYACSSDAVKRLWVKRER